MKKISLSELRTFIKSVIKEASEDREFPSMDTGSSYDEDWAKEYPEDNGRDPGPETEVLTADDVADSLDDGYAALDELVASAGYDDIAGDVKAIDQKFSFEVETDGVIWATDKDTGALYAYEDDVGLWEQLGEAIKRPIIRETTLKDTQRNLTADEVMEMSDTDDSMMDQLIGIAGYDDEAGDPNAPDKLFTFHMDQMDPMLTIVAQDYRTGREFFYDQNDGQWKDY